MNAPRHELARAAWARQMALLAAALVALPCNVARAQDDDEPEEAIDIDAYEASRDEEDDAELTEPRADPGDEGASEEQDTEVLLAWYGSLENDIGLARYDSEDDALTDDTLYDHRGRFVVAPMLHLPLPGGLFFEATGQLVAWVKDNEGSRLIEADDVWGKLGKKDVWDVQVGRFEAWRVYQKFPVRRHDLPAAFHSRGIGESAGAFDLFTLEDTGALVAPPVSNQSYYVDIYEVSYILLREEAGSVAFHYFPSDDLGFELHGKYGEQAQQNKLGARFAAIGRVSPALQLSAAAEYRTSRTGSPARSPDPMRPGEYLECDDCGRADQRGVGGGVVLDVGPLELSASVAYGSETGYRAVDGVEDSELTRELMSVGGYAELALGEAAVGGAANYTQRLDKADNFQTHLQTAAYAFYPLSRDLSLKLVITYAKGEDDRLENRDDIPPPNNAFYGVRLRLKYFFDVLM